jgi:hypothetical protein
MAGAATAYTVNQYVLDSDVKILFRDDGFELIAKFDFEKHKTEILLS